MNSTKSIFMSTTFYGSILALLASIDPALYNKILISLNVSDPNLVTAKIVGVIGFIIAVYGRFTATKLVTLIGKTKTNMTQIPRT